MKKLALALCFSILSTMGVMAQMTVENNVITVEVDENSSRNDLLDIRQELAEHGIDFRYNKVNRRPIKKCSLGCDCRRRKIKIIHFHESIRCWHCKISVQN
ncbi:MAG: hypothetical protein ACPGED_04165 [Flavobacteriales bacterium]